MKTIESIVRAIQKDLTPQFEQKLRKVLMEQDKEWLIEQVIRLTLDAPSLHEMDRKTMQRLKAKQREERMLRVRAMALDEDRMQKFTARYRPYDRSRLIAERYLLAEAPEKGADIISEQYRSDEGRSLLLEAKDVLFALLFGDESTNTHLQRTEQELLTITVPQFKASALDFMKATTEMEVHAIVHFPRRGYNP